ncbi:uncharacterized protein TrAFT101_008148 [Trichoderma asperellum]|uniref:uncharacterized protein n=1 Tax=Trichoderma asperellum TaxID=101201 RepID=UPI00331F2DE9|nr:hypothetical protein TrAFT101_008148 [Trichoderma asperellum]
MKFTFATIIIPYIFHSALAAPTRIERALDEHRPVERGFDIKDAYSVKAREEYIRVTNDADAEAGTQVAAAEATKTVAAADTDAETSAAAKDDAAKKGKGKDEKKGKKKDKKKGKKEGKGKMGEKGKKEGKGKDTEKGAKSTATEAAAAN